MAIASFEMPRIFSWNVRRMNLIFTNERNIQKSSAARKGHLGEEKPAPSAWGPKGADDGNPLRNNRADIHGSPTVNGDHFKRSRSQCVYLANVKFTRGKGELESIRAAPLRTYTAAFRRPVSLSLEKTVSIVLYRGEFVSQSWGVARVTLL